jgi:hypothetical protein
MVEETSDDFRCDAVESGTFKGHTDPGTNINPCGREFLYLGKIIQKRARETASLDPREGPFYGREQFISRPIAFCVLSCDETEPEIVFVLLPLAVALAAARDSY